MTNCIHITYSWGTQVSIALLCTLFFCDFRWFRIIMWWFITRKYFAFLLSGGFWRKERTYIMLSFLFKLGKRKETCKPRLQLLYQKLLKLFFFSINTILSNTGSYFYFGDRNKRHLPLGTHSQPKNNNIPLLLCKKYFQYSHENSGIVLSENKHTGQVCYVPFLMMPVTRKGF